MFHTPNGSDVMSWGFKLQECLRADIDDNEGVHAMTEDELDMLLSQPPSSRHSAGSQSFVSNLSTNTEGGACSYETVSSVGESEENIGDLPAPCCHNRWDNLRAKKNSVTLRCRECHQAWKTTTLKSNKCPYFTKDNCPEGAACTQIHVYRYKLSPKRRRMAAMSAAEGCCI